MNDFIKIYFKGQGLVFKVENFFLASSNKTFVNSPIQFKETFIRAVN